MKSKLIAAGLVLSVASLAYAGLTPIPLNPTSYNADPVIEKTAPPTFNDYVTVTPDQGTNKNGNTWFENGYNTNNPTTGIPAHGSLVTAIADTNHIFQMPPDYHTNCCIFVGHGNNIWTPIQGPGTFTLTTPAPFQKLSVLNSSGNGAVHIQYTVHYSDGSSETGIFSSTDWWSGTAANRVFDAAGLIGMNGGINNLSANHGACFYNDIALGNTTANVTKIDFQWLYGSSNGHSPWGNGRTCIFALSGSTDGTTFSPLAVTGYDHDVVVEADAPHTFGSGSVALTGTLTNDNTYCTFTMDGGIWRVNWTWYEKGYYAAFPNDGLPTAGSTITSVARPDITYTLPPTYVGNCAVCLSSNIPTAQINFATPAAYGGLALLASGGNNGTPLNIRVEIQFQGGQTETNWIAMPDWFNRTDPYAVLCFGQVIPGSRAMRNTRDQFADVFTGAGNPEYQAVAPGVTHVRDPRLVGGAQGPNLPIIRLFDLIVPVTNSTTPITSINLVTTNTGGWGNTASILAVSGAAGAPPVISQPASLVTDSITGFTNATTSGALLNNIQRTKGYQGTNNMYLYVTNAAGIGSPIAYQWKKAPRGGGYRDIFNTFNLSTFANVANVGNVSGANSSLLVISNATLADSADYIVVASNPYGSFTSCVATISVLTTNLNLLVGAGLGDTITKWSTDGSTGGSESFPSVIDQAEQKWLSFGLGGVGLDGVSVPQATVPFVGPIGFIVTPINGASIVNNIRFYCANDSDGRDPADYLIEGSNDQATWTRINGGNLLGTLAMPTARGGSGSTLLNPMAQPLTEVDFANTIAYKSYRFTITNVMDPFATALMQIAEIQLLGSLIPNPPVWVRQPEPTVTVFAGTAPTWGVLAAGYPAPKFQWYRGTTAIPNATNALYTLANPQLTDSGAQISCTAYNNAGSISSTASTLTVIAAPTQSYPTAVLANGPMAYWRLDEGPDNGAGNQGVITHDYAGGHNGYYTNMTLGVGGYNPASDPDTAARFGDFPPSDNFVAEIHNLDFARGTNTAGATFSIEAWVYGGNQTVDAAILTKGYNGGLNAGTQTGTEQFVLDLLGTPRKFRFMVRDFYGNGHPAQSAVVPTDPITFQPVWHHLVGVCDQPNGNIYLYVDGLLAATGTIPTNSGILAQTMPMIIGSRQSGQTAAADNQWSGTIDEVALYPSALSAGQVLGNFFAAQRPPLITLQPTNTTTPENVTVTFYSSAYGPGTLAFQWYLSDGINPTTQVAGQTSPNLTFTTSASQNLNFYQLVVTNNYGAVTGAVAQLTVISGPPSFLLDLPASDTFYVGHVIKLHVVAGGTAPFTYQWLKNNVNISNNYRTSGAQSDTLIIGYAATTDSGNYQVIVNNGQGTGQSAIDAVAVKSVTAVPFFNATSSGWSVQGTAPLVLTNNSVQLSDSNLGSIARSAFLTTKQNIASFHVAFLYQDVSGTGGADGVTFCIQNQSATAVGGGGGSLGYSGITPSVALAMNIYDPQTKGIALFQNGTVTTPFSSILPVALGANTDPIQVNLNYSGTVLTVTFTDTVTADTFTTNYTVNIPSIVGGSTAYVGFTGADGGVNSTEVISWSPPAVPIMLTSQVVGNSLVLSWSTSGGAYLMTATSLTGPWSPDTTDALQVVGSTSQVTVPSLSGTERFFRLQLFP